MNIPYIVLSEENVTMASWLASLTSVYWYTIAIGDPGLILCVTTKEVGQGRGQGCRENFVTLSIV